MPQRSSRNHRNNPYAIDRMFAQVHHSAAGAIWRFRTEITTLATGSAGAWELAKTVTTTWMLVILTASATAGLILPCTRRFIVRRAWCVLSRHRIQRVCFETRMHTRSGRLPLVLRITPTEVGERVTIWCRAGICFEDFEAHTGELAAACYAREARIERSKRSAQIVQVNIVRRDTLAAHHVITSSLANKAPAVPPAARNDAA